VPARFGKVASILAVSLALGLLPATPAAAGVHQGTWRGTTGEQRNIAFRVNGSEQVTWLRFKIEVESVLCKAVITWEASGSYPIRPDGTFVVKGMDGLSSFRVQGVFLGRARAEGIAKTTVFDPCFASGRTQWKATKVL